MIRYRCDYCGVFFDEPTVTRHSESIDRRIRRYSEEHCPICGGDSFTESNTCPGCFGQKLLTDLLCDSCRESLKARVIGFFDTLTAREEQQFDDWMDGCSIQNRKDWK